MDSFFYFKIISNYFYFYYLDKNIKNKNFKFIY